VEKVLSLPEVKNALDGICAKEEKTTCKRATKDKKGRGPRRKSLGGLFLQTKDYAGKTHASERGRYTREDAKRNVENSTERGTDRQSPSGGVEDFEKD